MTLQELNLTRRSVNFFDKNKELNMTLVKKIIDEASYAPSAYNLQPWRIVMVKSDGAKEKLYNLAYKQQKIMDAPMTLIIIGDKEGYESHNIAWNEFREKLGEEKTNKIIAGARKAYGASEESKLKFEESNTGLFAMNLMLLFKAYGIESHPLSGMKFDEIKSEFDLSKTEEVVMLLSVGYFDESKKLTTRRKRKTYADLVTEI